MTDQERQKRDSIRWWTGRLAALEAVLGPSDEIVGHATTPFDLGKKLGGGADVLYFRNHLEGIVCVTAELIGRDQQLPNALGSYELMVCQREESDWGADLISRLAYVTCETALNPGDTMAIRTQVPEAATIQAVLFCPYASFRVRGRNAGLLLCLGITAQEQAACQQGQADRVEAELKAAGIYPYTDLFQKVLFDAPSWKC